MQAYLTLEAYPEVADVLRRLRAAGLKLAILSNGEPAMLAAAVDNAGIGALLDAVLSVEEVGVYKPDPRVYRLAVDRLAVRADQIAFQSSNAWDVHGAACFRPAAGLDQPFRRAGRAAAGRCRARAAGPVAACPGCSAHERAAARARRRRGCGPAPATASCARRRCSNPMR